MAVAWPNGCSTEYNSSSQALTADLTHSGLILRHTANSGSQSTLLVCCTRHPASFTERHSTACAGTPPTATPASRHHACVVCLCPQRHWQPYIIDRPAAAAQGGGAAAAGEVRGGPPGRLRPHLPQPRPREAAAVRRALLATAAGVFGPPSRGAAGGR